MNYLAIRHTVIGSTRGFQLYAHENTSIGGGANVNSCSIVGAKGATPPSTTEWPPAAAIGLPSSVGIDGSLLFAAIVSVIERRCNIRIVISIPN